MEVQQIDNRKDEEKPRETRHALKYSGLRIMELIMSIVWVLAASLLFSSLATAAPVCDCNPSRPETMRTRQCSLCAEAEKHSTDDVFFLKDINPRKPNRWLALPREHAPGQHDLHDMHPAARIRLWKAAIAKGIELFGEGNWGVAYNGPAVRTQCHAHVHIGRFITVAELDYGFIVVNRPEEIPSPPNVGIWVHPAGGKLHVHTGEQITETVLVR